MSKQPLISVIIPVYKVEQYLDNCINSLLAQTYKNLEIILVDDGSPDNCPALCDEYAKKDSRIIVIHKQNEGVSAARNDGINIAKGNFIAFVDSDDSIEPNMYEKLIKKQQTEDFDLVFSRYNYEQDGQKTNVLETDLKKLCDNYDLTLFFNHVSNINDPSGKIIVNNSIMCNIWRVLFKKDAINNFRFPIGIKYMEDFVFMINLLVNQNLKLGFIDDYLYNYLLRDNSACHNKNFGMIENSKKYLSAINPILKNTKYEQLIKTLEFFCYSECVISKYIFGAKLDLKSIKHWKSKENYKVNKTITYGKKQKIKYMLIYYKLHYILAWIYKIKK